MSEDGEPDFYYVVYDMWNKGDDYNERFAKLNDWFYENGSNYLKLITNDVVFTPRCAEGYLEQHINNGYEGVMLRCPRSPYKQGRSTFKEGYLLKLKKFLDDEAVVIGFEERLHNTNEKESDERVYAKRSSKKEGMVRANTLGSLIVAWGDIEFGMVVIT